mgnify:CR=1 FL=1
MILTRKVINSICNKVEEFGVDCYESSIRFEILRLLGEEVAINSILTAERAMKAYEELKKMETKCDMLGTLHFKTRDAFVTFNPEIKEIVVYSNKFEVECGDDLFEHKSFKSIDLMNVKLTDKCTSCDDMFCGCSALEEVDFHGVDFSNVTSTRRMFIGCNKLKEVYLAAYSNKVKLYKADRMFENCNSLEEITMFNFEFTDFCSMDSIFDDCDNLHKIDMGIKLTMYNKSMLELMLKGTLKSAKVTSIDFDLYTIITSTYSAEALTKIKQVKERKNHHPLLDKEYYWNKVRELIIRKGDLLNNMSELSILKIAFTYEHNIIGGN